MKNKIARIAVVLAVISMMVFLTACGQLNTAGSPTGAAVTTGQCEIAPTATMSVVDKEQQGTSVTAGTKYIVNGKYKSGVPTLVKGDKVQLLANASSYIDTLSDEKVVGCGANVFDVEMYDFAAPTVVIKDDTATLTDNAAGGAVNATGFSQGGSDTYTIEITPANNDATGELVFVVELGNNANVSSITLSDSNGNALPKVAVPSFYATTLTTSPEVAAFAMPNMVDAIEKVYKLTVQAADGKDIAGAVYTTFYAKQAFVDIDGKAVASGVEDSNFNTQYEATFDYDFKIKP